MEPIKEYDEDNNLIHWKRSDGYEEWHEYDENNNCVHSKNSYGYEHWHKWENNKYIDITQQEFEQIKYRKIEKEFLSREEISIFELMDI